MSLEIAVSLEIIDKLRQQLGVLQMSTDQAAVECISTGCPAWDAWLLGSVLQQASQQQASQQQASQQQASQQQGGFRRGQLVEWLAASPGYGAGTLALIVAGQAATEERVVVVVDRACRFYPPAASALGLDLSRLILLRPQTVADEVWALDQSLRCPAVAAVWACLDRLDGRDFRRLKLAAEQSGTLGMFVRPARVQAQPSWSDLQLLVTPQALPQDVLPETRDRRQESGGDTRGQGTRLPTQRRWEITMLRCRQGVAGRFILLEMNDTTGQLQVVSARTSKIGYPSGMGHETHSLHLAAQLARPASSSRSARA